MGKIQTTIIQRAKINEVTFELSETPELINMGGLTVYSMGIEGPTFIKIHAIGNNREEAIAVYHQAVLQVLLEHTVDAVED